MQIVVNFHRLAAAVVRGDEPKQDDPGPSESSEYWCRRVDKGERVGCCSKSVNRSVWVNWATLTVCEGRSGGLHCLECTACLCHCITSQHCQVKIEKIF